MIKFLLLISLFNSVGFAARFVREVEQPLEHAYIPMGFDTDDSVQIVVQGKFDKSCIQLGPQSTQLDSEQMEIRVLVNAYEYNGNCTNPGATFHQTIYLGLLQKAGHYKVIDETSKKELGTLVVEAATGSGAGTDDLQYAPLTDAYLEKEAGNWFLVLRILSNSFCGGLKEVEFKAYQDVLVALPKFGPKGFCAPFPIAYEKRVPVTVTVPQMPFLLHVRSMSGQAINKMNYNIEER